MNGRDKWFTKVSFSAQFNSFFSGGATILVLVLASFHLRRSRSRSRNRKRRAIRSSENQSYEVGSRTPYPLTTPSLTIQWNLDGRSRKLTRKNKPITMFVSGPCDWLILRFLLLTPTMNFSLDRKRRSRRRNRKKWKRSESSDFDSVELMTPLMTPIRFSIFTRS